MAEAGQFISARIIASRRLGRAGAKTGGQASEAKEATNLQVVAVPQNMVVLGSALVGLT